MGTITITIAAPRRAHDAAPCSRPARAACGTRMVTALSRAWHQQWSMQPTPLPRPLLGRTGPK
jgi:hypothetical protein